MKKMLMRMVLGLFLISLIGFVIAEQGNNSNENQNYGNNSNENYGNNSICEIGKEYYSNQNNPINCTCPSRYKVTSSSP
jgi:hypothetical protein